MLLTKKKKTRKKNEKETQNLAHKFLTYSSRTQIFHSRWKSSIPAIRSIEEMRRNQVPTKRRSSLNLHSVYWKKSEVLYIISDPNFIALLVEEIRNLRKWQMLRLRAFRPTNDKIVKIQLHPTHPWLVTADASDHVSVWNWEHRQVFNFA